MSHRSSPAPLRFTWLDPFLPDVALSRSPGSGATSRDADLARIVQARITHIVCLQEGHELERFDDTLTDRRRACARLGLAFTHAPTEDFCAPSLDRLIALCASIQRTLAERGRVLVHCQAGLGRAGTVAACLLAQRGMSAPDAIATVRYLRPGAIQSDAQERAIHAFASTQHSAR